MYIDQDPPKYIEFMKKIMANEFPEGEYVVKGYVSFRVEDTSEEISIEEQIEFRVN